MSGSIKTLQPQVRSFDLNRESVDVDARTAELTFSTETDQVERWFGREILDHSPASVRMERMNNRAALLMDHDQRDQVGVIESAAIRDGKGSAVVRFSKSARGEEILQDVKDGIRTKVSVGYRVHDLRLESEDDDISTYRVTDWEPFEVSIVSIPADDNAGIRTAESIFGQRTAELSTQVTMSKPAEETQERATELEPTAPEAKADTATAPAEVRTKTPEKAPEPQREFKVDPKEVQRAAAEEADRRDEIRALGDQFEIDKAVVRKAINENVDVETFRSQTVLKALEERNKPFSTGHSDEPADELQVGTRAHTMTQWSESAKNALGSRGRSIVIPDYSKQPEIKRNYIDGQETSFHRSLAGAVTLADVAKLDVGIGSPIIDETSTHAPEVAVFPVDVISGATVELSVLKDLPSVGFRNANEGSTSKKGTFESKIFQTQVIEQPIEVDIQGVLNASRDPGRVLMAEAMAVSKAVMEHIAKQTWYAGTAQSIADSKAAPGLIAQAETAATHVVDAGGSTNQTSIWLIELGNNSCDHVYGNDTTLNFGQDWLEETVEDGSGNKLRALVNYISGRVAPRLSNRNAAIRIKNIDTGSNKADDDLIYSAFKLAEDLGMQPNAIFMNPRSKEQIRASRTATTTTGAPAPIPDNIAGVPIYTTRNILNAETV